MDDRERRDGFLKAALAAADWSECHFGSKGDPYDPFPWQAKMIVRLADAVIAEANRTAAEREVKYVPPEELPDGLPEAVKARLHEAIHEHKSHELRHAALEAKLDLADEVVRVGDSQLTHDDVRAALSNLAIRQAALDEYERRMAKPAAAVPETIDETEVEVDQERAVLAKTLSDTTIKLLEYNLGVVADDDLYRSLRVASDVARHALRKHDAAKKTDTP